MSGLFSSLNSAVSALTAHSRSVEVAGKNLANVNNSSYARQRVIYGDRGVVITADGAESMGLEALGVEQIRDKLLDQQVVRETALSAYFQAQQSAYQRAQAGLGQNVASAGSTTGVTNSSKDTGIGAALDDFFAGFQKFASNPTDTGVRQTLIQTTTILTDRVQNADARLAQVQVDLDTQVASDVKEANRLLDTIAELNGQIASVEAQHPGSAIDLRDQRQKALEELARKIPVTTVETSDGQVDVSTGSVLLVDDSTVPGALAYNSTTHEVTSGASATVLTLTSGSIAGSIKARTEAVQTLRDQLSTLAENLVKEVNDLYRTTDNPHDFFRPGPLPAGETWASYFQLDAGIDFESLRADDTVYSGDATIAQAIANLANDNSIAGLGTSFKQYYSNAVTGLGQEIAGANARLEDQNRIEALVRSQRDAVSGVSLDEEMGSLMKFQRAFQASSRVFQTVDNLLDVVVNQLGR